MTIARVAIDLDERQPGEMREPTGDRRLVAGAHHLLGQCLTAARAGKTGATVEFAVLDPARRNVILAAGVGARWMAGDQVVDFEPIFDGADAVFEGAVGSVGMVVRSNGVGLFRRRCRSLSPRSGGEGRERDVGAACA